ncbi:hypothetical protein, partial [Pseudomonas sp. Sample_24]|uniref:hypothetical protein n=1 Tax=Pseudomonas sp. Sample_24 TaxID=2448268 RepID=UPI001F4FB202
GKSRATMIGVWQADMSGLSGKSKSARIVAEPAALRDPMIGKSLIALRQASHFLHNAAMAASQ